VRVFYALLAQENLPLPSLTVLTHWHWDHTFGMHAVNGLTLANAQTDRYLAEWKRKVEKDGPGEFMALDESIRREYRENAGVIVRQADIVFTGEMTLDTGGCAVTVMQTETPHTDDSPLVYVQNDKTLFLGDSTCHEFLTGIKNRDLCGKLADTIRGIHPEICMEGHWVPMDPEDTLADLMGDT
jgi:glyoxylase-like metal-dependent hydrolase (beta-lactamase superfamily II)